MPISEHLSAPASLRAGRFIPRNSGRLRRVVAPAVAVGALGGLLLIVLNGRGTLASTSGRLMHASPWWVVTSLLLAVAGYVASASGVVTVGAGVITLRRSILLETAGTFCNRFTPGSLGSALLRLRYLQSAGLTFERAGTGLALIALTGAAIQLLGLGFGLSVGNSRISHTLMASWQATPILEVFGLLFLTALAIRQVFRLERMQVLRERLAGRRRSFGLQLRESAKDPLLLARLLAAALGSSSARLLAFFAATQAVGVGVNLTAAALAYYAGTALANAAPVPGGVGPAELSLTAGLSAVGGGTAQALAAVLIFRLATFWLPTIAWSGGVALAAPLRRALPDRGPLRGGAGG